MASISGVCNNLLDSILPTYGKPRVKTPIWNESQHMFITDQYTSAAGNTYYLGVRFSDRFVTILHIGLYHSWTYIDAIEVYAFNGTRLELVQKHDYEKTFRSEEFVRSESELMVRNFLEGILKIHRTSMPEEEIVAKAKTIVDSCYKSFLDSDFNVRITKILPQIGE